MVLEAKVAATKKFGELTGFELVPDAPTRRPVLFVHGWWGGAWIWDRFMSAFAKEGHPCYAVNLRGYHDSKPVPDVGKVTLDDHVEDMATALAALEDPILVTHSASGHLGLRLGESRKLAAVVHLVPTPPLGIWSTRLALGLLPYMPRILTSKGVILDKRDMLALDLNCLPPDEQEAVYARMVPSPGLQGRQLMTRSVDPKRITGRRLVVSGSDDRLVEPQTHRAIAKKYGAEYREYPAHGHYLMREPGWEQIAGDVIAWLVSAGP